MEGRAGVQTQLAPQATPSCHLNTEQKVQCVFIGLVFKEHFIHVHRGTTTNTYKHNILITGRKPDSGGLCRAGWGVRTKRRVSLHSKLSGGI